MFSTIEIISWGEMNTMSRKILITSLLAIASAIGFCAQAKAETVDVPFSGTIAPKCVFSNVVSGTLAQGSYPGLIEGSGANGAKGSVDVLCNIASTVSVSEPVNDGSTGLSVFDGSYEGSVIELGSNRAGSPKAILNGIGGGVTATSVSVNSGTTARIKVNVIKQSTLPLLAGDYKFKVTLTSTP
jgi:hypothetical protein